MNETHRCIAGDPDGVIEHLKHYEAAGTDLLLCLVKPKAPRLDARRIRF